MIVSIVETPFGLLISLLGISIVSSENTTSSSKNLQEGIVGVGWCWVSGSVNAEFVVELNSWANERGFACNLVHLSPEPAINTLIISNCRVGVRIIPVTLCIIIRETWPTSSVRITFPLCNPELAYWATVCNSATASCIFRA